MPGYYVIITLLCHIITLLLHHYYVIITSLLRHYYCNNGSIITVIMGPLLPIITKSIMGNNESIITHYVPTQLADDRREMQGILLCPALEGRPFAAFILIRYKRNTQYIPHVAKSSVSTYVPFRCSEKNILVIGAGTNFDCRPSELHRVLTFKS